MPVTGPPQGSNMQKVQNTINELESKLLERANSFMNEYFEIDHGPPVGPIEHAPLEGSTCVNTIASDGNKIPNLSMSQNTLESTGGIPALTRPRGVMCSVWTMCYMLKRQVLAYLLDRGIVIAILY